METSGLEELLATDFGTRELSQHHLNWRLEVGDSGYPKKNLVLPPEKEREDGIMGSQITTSTGRLKCWDFLFMCITGQGNVLFFISSPGYSGIQPNPASYFFGHPEEPESTES